LYAVGVICYELFAGHHPFSTENTGKLIQAVLNETPDVFSLEIDSEMREVLEKLLDKKPENRYSSAAQVIRALNEATNLTLPVETSATRESFLQAAPFAGREAELAVLLHELENAVAGQGGGWLIGGESGVGKSRLIDELKTYALVKGALVLRGQGISESGNPYQPWRDVIRRLCLTDDLTPADMSILKPLVPDIAALMRQDDVPDAPELDAAAAQDRLFRTVEQLLRRQEQLTVLILEDLHWSDAASLLLLERIVNLTGKHKLLVIGTFRDDDRPDLADKLKSMKVLKLRRLSDEGIESLATSILGEGGRQQAVIDLLKKESDGNAFFLIEVVRALTEQMGGHLDDIAQNPLPEKVFAGKVSDILQRRLDRVTPESRRLLRLAAVSGRHLDRPVLLEIIFSASGTTPLKTLNLDDWLRTCAEAAILEVEDEAWRFAHNKIREGLLGELTAEELAGFHYRVAAAIEKVYPGGKDHLAVLAYHYEMAGSKDKAAEYYRRAAKEAQEAYAPEAAIDYYHKALSFLSEDALSARLNIYNGLGKMLRWQTRFDEARAIYASMRDAAESTGDKVARAQAWIGLGDVESNQGNREAAYENAVYAEAAARSAGDSAQAELVEALGNRAWGLYRLRKYEEGLTVAQEMLDLSTRLNFRSEIGRGQNILGIVNFMLGRVEQAVNHMQQALDISRELGDKNGIALRLNNLGEFHRHNGNHTEAVQFYEQALPVFREIGRRDAELVLLNNLGGVRVALGEYQAAENDLRQIAELVGSGDWWGFSESYRFLAEACLGQRKYEEAAEAAYQALLASQKSGEQEEIGKAWRVLGIAAAKTESPVSLNGVTYTASGCYEESLKIFIDDNAERAHTLREWARYELQHGSDEKGGKMFMEARDIFQKLGLEQELNRM
jgi:predicted ATPase